VSKPHFNVCRRKEAGSQDFNSAADHVNIERHPVFPNLPDTSPLTYSLTTAACLHSDPLERPTFSQVLAVLNDLVAEVASGTYLSAAAIVQVCFVSLCCASFLSFNLFMVI
jgi:hypothetical protein